MDATTVLRIMDALAEKIEVLTERLAEMSAKYAEVEKRLAEKCSCEKWASGLRPGAVFPQRDDGAYLSESELDAVLLSMTNGPGTG